MRLIGMLDSPYVRRVAISLDMLGINFEHKAVSVFKNFDEFKSINPVVKAPTLVCDHGEVLMDSSLILQFIEASMANGKSLWTKKPAQLPHEFRAVGLALAACDKGVQYVYETNLRPAAAQYEPWLARVAEQITAALNLLEAELTNRQHDVEQTNNQASITAAVAWHFIQSMLPSLIAKENYPNLVKLSTRMEADASFIKFPAKGPGVVRAN